MFMRYIIMADGKGSRWKNYKGIPKHLVEINGEKIIQRIIRLIRELDPQSEIIVTSHNPAYEFDGAVRYEPRNNNLEIDRFTEELIVDNICFLYGDTFYTKECMEKIINQELAQLTFFGNTKSIVGIKVKDGALFREHIDKVKQLYIEGKIQKCIGWQVYQSYVGMPIGVEKIIGINFINVQEESFDINSPEDYKSKVIQEKEQL